MAEVAGTGFSSGSFYVNSPVNGNWEDYVSDEDGRYGEIPTLDQTEADNIIAAKWYSGFGNWSQKIDAYLALGTLLKAIAVSYGNNDSYTWIKAGTADFAEQLRARGIDPVDFAFEGGHQMPVKVVSDHLGPFFNENLSWEA